MANNNFSIIYDTESTKKHEVDAAILGVSILAMNDALQDADKVINGEESEVKINVIANKPGSFGVEFVVTQLLPNATDILTVLGFTAITASAFKGSVLGVIEQLKSQKVKVVHHRDNDRTEIELDDGSMVKCTNKVMELATSQSFRTKCESVLFNDLTKEHGAKVKFLNETGIVTQELGEKTLTHFKKQASQIAITEVEDTKDVEARFTQVNLYSKSGWKVKLESEDTDFSIKMNDDAFLERINSRDEKFIKGDLFKVKLKRVTKYKSGSKPNNTMSIEKVLRHRVEASRKLI
jgi:anthranilate/para-aminobenzoate synthase component I